MFRGRSSGASVRAPSGAGREPGEMPESAGQIEPSYQRLGMKIEYCDVIKKKAEDPAINSESELSLDGMVMAMEGRFHKIKSKVEKMYHQLKGVDQMEEAMVIPNQTVMHRVLNGKDEAEGKAERATEKSMPCFTCIESAKLPFEYEGDEGDSKMDSGDDNNDPLTELMASVSQRRLVGYMRGMATSSFYGCDFEAASEYLRKEFDPDESSMDGEIDAQLMDLECDLYRNECRHIERKTVMFVDSVGKAADENMHRLILTWIGELQSSDRHYGAILLCLAVLLRQPLNQPDYAAQYFNLDYYTFVEMALRVVYVMGRNATYSNRVVFLLDVMDKSISQLKVYLDECPSIIKKYIRKKISICYLALSYCCNSAGLYETAESCVNDGMRNSAGEHVTTADLLVNRAASLLGRRELPKAREDLDDALEALEREAIGGERSAINWRVELTKKMRKRLKKMEKQKKKEDKWSRGM